MVYQVPTDTQKVPCERCCNVYQMTVLHARYTVTNASQRIQTGREVRYAYIGEL